MQLLILTLFLAGTLAAPMQQSLSVNEDGSYQFYYETGKDAGSHSRTEVRQPDGVVIGKFSYEDPNGDIREVNYRADDAGYVANGDVSVEGAPKSQFPVAPEEQNDTPSPTVEEGENHETSDAKEPQEAAESHQEEGHKEEDDIKDLSLEESVVDDPPEGFPQGYFLQHFQGLRRLPEPVKEEKPTTPQPTTESGNDESPPKNDVAPEPLNEPIQEDEEPNKIGEKVANEMELFMHLRPFQSFSPQQMDSSMFRQPVYVFSYQHPDSYGYHYFF